jgi:hypothetical protein
MICIVRDIYRNDVLYWLHPRQTFTLLNFLGLLDPPIFNTIFRLRRCPGPGGSASAISSSSTFSASFGFRFQALRVGISARPPAPQH